MKFSDWVSALVNCLRERQFWYEALRELLRLLTNPSVGLSVALLTAIFTIGHRVADTARKITSLQTNDDLVKRLPRPVNTNA